jgi:hypothetical protein
MDGPYLLAGATILALALWDIFQSIVVPRPTPGALRLGRYIVPLTWRAWRSIGLRLRSDNRRDAFLGLYAPGTAILLLAVWLTTIVVGYGLILYGLRADVVPSPADPLEAVYFAGTSVLTIGYGEIVATGGAARVVVLVAGATGLGVVALVVTFLFSLFASFQKREVLVVTLSARAKAPPSAVMLLETHARLGLVDELPGLFRDWETWAAEVLDSHVAYPLLGYFRSSHDNISWISALGAILDAAALVVTTVRGLPRGQAEITIRVGAHLVEDIANVLRRTGDGPAVEPESFRQVYDRLAGAGYELEPFEDAWRRFRRTRSTYADRLAALADYWATPALSWVGHRTSSSSVGHVAEPAEVVAPQ